MAQKSILSALTLGLLLAGSLAAQNDIPGEMAQALATSTLHYELEAQGPLAKPAAELHCPPRGTATHFGSGADGSRQLLPWKPAEAAAPLFAAAEKLFAAQNYGAAGEAYQKGLALDPTYGPGWLHAGDVPFAQGNFPLALAFYTKALNLDPTLAQSHRFAADTLMKLGRLDEAKDEYIRALVLDPSADGTYEGLKTLGGLAGFTVARHEFLPPAGALGEVQENTVRIALGDSEKEWTPYFICRAVWRNEASYRARRLGKAGEGPYNWTVQEETECLLSLLIGNLNSAEEKVKAEAARLGHPMDEVPLNNLLSEVSPLVRHLREVADAQLLPGYALFAVLGQRCPIGISLLPEKAHEDLERYIRRFVIVPTPATSAAVPAAPVPTAPPAMPKPPGTR